MRRGCKGKLIEEKSEDTLLHEDPPEYMMEVDSMADAPLQHPSRTGSTSEPLENLSSKLQYFFPTLFSLLTLWEKEAMDNSGVLSRPFSRDHTQVGGGCVSYPFDKTTQTLVQEADKPSYRESDPLGTEPFSPNLTTGVKVTHSSGDLDPWQALSPSCPPMPPFHFSSNQTSPNLPVYVSSSPQTELLESVILLDFRDPEEDADDHLLALDSYLLKKEDSKYCGVFGGYKLEDQTGMGREKLCMVEGCSLRSLTD